MKLFLVILAISGLAIALPQKQKPEGRLIGGEDSDIKEASFTLSVRYYTAHICGAAIVSNQIAVTTANCLKNKNVKGLTVKAGSTYLDQGGVIVNVVDYYIHPYYKQSTREYDIAVFKLEKDLFEVSDVTTMVELSNYQIDTNAEVTVYGWGVRDITKPNLLTRRLQALKTTVVGNIRCSTLLNRTIYDSSMMCTYSRKMGMCKGDEGSPLINPYDDNLIGLASFRNSEECGPNDFVPDVYSHIKPLRLWIQSIINKWE